MMIAVSLNCLLNEPHPVPFSLTLLLAELSGDTRVDLSTPLLDTLIMTSSLSLLLTVRHSRTILPSCPRLKILQPQVKFNKLPVNKLSVSKP